VYKLVLDNPERTVHFARSSGTYANELGFTDFLVEHGLTRKLSRDTVKESATMKKVQGEGWVDMAASKSLSEEVRGTGVRSSRSTNGSTARRSAFLICMSRAA